MVSKRSWFGLKCTLSQHQPFTLKCKFKKGAHGVNYDTRSSAKVLVSSWEGYQAQHLDII